MVVVVVVVEDASYQAITSISPEREVGCGFVAIPLVICSRQCGTRVVVEERVTLDLVEQCGIGLGFSDDM